MILICSEDEDEDEEDMKLTRVDFDSRQKAYEAGVVEAAQKKVNSLGPKLMGRFINPKGTIPLECLCGGPAGHVPGGIWCRK